MKKTIIIQAPVVRPGVKLKVVTPRGFTFTVCEPSNADAPYQSPYLASKSSK